MIRALVAAIVVATLSAASAAPPVWQQDSGTPRAAIQLTPPLDTALERRTSAVAAELRCPVCQGLSVEDSPSELALELRAVVRDQLRAGRTPEQVKEYFVGRYGEWILMRPKARGFNWLAYLLPLGVLAGGGVVVFFAVRRWTDQAAANTNSS